MAEVKKSAAAASPEGLNQPGDVLEGGTYEIIRNRLASQSKDLRTRLGQLNEARKEVFGAIDLALLGTDRITTDNNCMAEDLVPVGSVFVFGYNVQIGLKSETKLSDVFAVYAFEEETQTFHQQPLDLLSDPRFVEDFHNLYRYYKQTVFAKFSVIGPHLFMVFQVGKSAADIKTFKWLIQDDGLAYVDGRSDHEFRYPAQHEFEWKRATRDMHRFGKHPHISIEDRVFVETIGGDLTIKVEDNTEDGSGIYTEDVTYSDQTLDDAEVYYAILDHTILLKIRPYQERDFRFIVFNEKVVEARRIDAIQHACVRLPEDHGIIFSNGYYLHTGEYKTFDAALASMKFEKRVASSNGEDYLYVFYDPVEGDYVLLSYNLIEQQVSTPIHCNGYSIFADGRLIYFRVDEEPKKHHVLQVWQTPYVGPNYVLPVTKESYLQKIGNRDIVRCMAECHEVLTHTGRDDAYANLYLDLVKKTRDILDSYYWVGDEQAFNLAEPLREIKDTASSAIEEYEKVVRIRKQTQEALRSVEGKTEALLKDVRRSSFADVNEYVHALAELRTVRGEIISLRDLRYTDLELADELETEVAEASDALSVRCVEFLLEPDALAPYEAQVAAHDEKAGDVQKVAEAKEVEADLDTTGSELDLLIEIVSNLQIDDATQTTQILDNISEIYAHLNRSKATLKRRMQELGEVERAAEFGAQLKLLSQSVINFLDISDTPVKCEEYLTKVMVQMSEIESRFAEFETFVEQLTEKREEIYNAFETKRLSLIEARNKRTAALQRAAERILDGIRSRLRRFESVDAINSYFAADLMVAKVRDIIDQLNDLEDSVKAADIQSQLKTVREEATRQLKDRQELFIDGQQLIQFGQHTFSVNTQDLDMTTVYRDDTMCFHLTGTNFFEPIDDERFLAARPFWEQEMVSQSKTVFRAEYLAYLMFREAAEGENNSLSDLRAMDDAGLLAHIQAFMGPRYDEGYVKGVDDHDAAILLRALVDIHHEADLLRFSPSARACALVFWQRFVDPEAKQLQASRLKGLNTLFQVFPNGQEHYASVGDLREAIGTFVESSELFSPGVAQEAGAYLFHELTRDDEFVISQEAATLVQGFTQHLKAERFAPQYQTTVDALKDDPVGQYTLIRTWVQAYTQQVAPEAVNYLDEAGALLFCDAFDARRVVNVSTQRQLTGLVGNLPLNEEGAYTLQFSAFMARLRNYTSQDVPAYRNYVALKKELVDDFKERLRLESFKPKVLTSFVRNKLIDQVYLPLIGDNLAKQIGTAGEQTRTDRMGLLMLISPPGYGKTTLMEYIASRLGLTFIKINGPSIGHEVTSLDQAAAPNAAARQEVEKLNLGFEMGDNLMLYVDDIQHCHPEFLQKFISLCDAQRRVEGVYRGKPKSYDLRGKKVAVVMAGNPYTEQGDQFKVPDMLANRADTYNLGDIIGGKADVFELSYIENAMTSNPVLNRVATKSLKDIYTFIQLAETGSREGLDFEGSYSGEEVQEIVSVLKKMMLVRNVVLRVNLEYIRSAAQADAYRTEPPFLLQGSYRNMNRLAEKVLPLLNQKELITLVVSHYENEAQVLTTAAEFNLLRFKEMTKWISEEEAERLESIRTTFMKNQAFEGLAAGDRMTQVLAQLSALTEGLGGIRDVLTEALHKDSGS